MKKQKLAAVLVTAAVLGLSACGGGSKPAESSAQETEAPAGSEQAAESAEETEAETEAETEPETEEEKLSVTLEHERSGAVFEFFYPAEGVELKETSVFGDPAYQFISEEEGCYITVNPSNLYTSDIKSRLSSYENLTYGPYTGWTEYTSYAAEGFMIAGEYEDKTLLLKFKIGNAGQTPADEAELKGYLDSGLVKGILSDVVVNLEAPEEPETEETTKAAEDEVIVDGVAHLKYADVVLPEGWSVDRVKNFEIKLTRDEKVPGNAPGDLLTPTLTISTTSSNKSAKEWAETKFKDFGSKGEIKNENIGGIDWVYFMPVEDQFYMFTDSSAGTHVDVSGMFFTIDEEIEGILSGITIK